MNWSIGNLSTFPAFTSHQIKLTLDRYSPKDLSSLSISDSGPKRSQRFDTNVNILCIHYAPRSETRRRQSKTNYHRAWSAYQCHESPSILTPAWFPFIHVQLSRNLFFLLLFAYLINDQIASIECLNKRKFFSVTNFFPS